MKTIKITLLALVTTLVFSCKDDTSAEISKTVSTITPEPPKPSTAPDWQFYTSGTCANGEGNLWRDGNTYSPTYRMTSCCKTYKIKRAFDIPDIKVIQYIDCKGISRNAHSVGGDGNYTTIEAREGSIVCDNCIYDPKVDY
jgi:hypothetical protein